MKAVPAATAILKPRNFMQPPRKKSHISRNRKGTTAWQDHLDVHGCRVSFSTWTGKSFTVRGTPSISRHFPRSPWWLSALFRRFFPQSIPDFPVRQQLE